MAAPEDSGAPPPKRVFSLVSIAEEKDQPKGYALYELHFDQEGDDGDLSQKCPIVRYGCSSGSRAVSLGSKIYILGGSCVGSDSSCCILSGDMHHFHSEVYCFDTLLPQDGWQACHSMLCSRRRPVVLAVDGKIYVFGGSYKKKFSAEVYDPEKNEWQYLPKVPRKGYRALYNDGGSLTPINAVVADSDGSNKRILLHSPHTRPLYAYHVDSSSWLCLERDFVYGDPDYFHLSTTNVVLNDFLYCHSEYTGEMISYDLIEKKWFPIEDIFGVEGNEKIFTAFMLLVGGDTLYFLFSYLDLASSEDKRFPDIKIECIICKINENNMNGRFPLSKSSVTRADRRTFKVRIEGVKIEGHIFGCFLVL